MGKTALIFRGAVLYICTIYLKPMRIRIFRDRDWRPAQHHSGGYFIKLAGPDKGRGKLWSPALLETLCYIPARPTGASLSGRSVRHIWTVCETVFLCWLKGYCSPELAKTKGCASCL